MLRSNVHRHVHRLAVVLLLALAAAAPAAAQPAAQGSAKERCPGYDRLRQPFFGATHLHTGLSFDASIRFVPSTPREAYAFAKGKAPLPGTNQFGVINPTEYAKLDRPLDWGAVTDHSEHFGEIGICKAGRLEVGPAREGQGIEDPPGRYSYDCQLLNGFYWQHGTHTLPSVQRDLAKNAFAVLVLPNLAPSSRNARLPLCASGEGDCDQAELDVWREMQEAAKEAYEPCTFSSFVGYEVASTPGGTNWHRNVIFRNQHVVERPITTIHMAREPNPDPNRDPMLWFNAPDVEKLWSALRKECLEAGTGCDVLTIPHNSNLGGGVPGLVPPLFFDPNDARQAGERQAFEPLVEIYQDKGSSECRWDPRFNEGVETTDELCDFELLDTTTLLGASGVGTGGSQEGLSPDQFNPRAFVRNVLKDGLLFQQQYKVNPFKLGIVASSDSHNGTMGWHPENATYRGHLGIEDYIPVHSGSTIQNSSGGHSVVWAEENTRDAIFDALKRRETYGTSGTRPVVRFFGGWGFERGLCERQDWVADGYRDGVPMGGDLPAAPPGTDGPRFVVAAWMDDFVGTPLQQIDVVKGWVDADGKTYEKVFTVAGGRDGATVDLNTCEPQGRGHESLCTVFHDREFDPAQPAFYYARVLENPVCRYSTHFCIENYGLNPLSTNCANRLKAMQNGTPEERARAMDAAMCCNNETSGYYVQPIIQERAWTSPIWYTPGS